METLDPLGTQVSRLLGLQAARARPEQQALRTQGLQGPRAVLRPEQRELQDPREKSRWSPVLQETLEHPG